VPATSLGPAPFTGNVTDRLVTDVQVKVRTTGYLITWEEPVVYEDAVGYLVVLTAKKTNKVVARQFAVPGQTAVVFTGPPLRKDTCIRINTLVDTGKEVRIARQPVRNCAVIGKAYAGPRPS
jgi:hypothetical protein